jgi:hypothetical protein
MPNENMMKLSKENNRTLMLALHQQIEEYAEYTADKLNKGDVENILNYPPNCELTTEEIEALKKIQNDNTLKSGLRKIIANNSSGVIFELLNFIDGTTDPSPDLGGWTEIAFVDKTDEVEPSNDMLHDEFYSTYWDWLDNRSAGK